MVDTGKVKEKTYDEGTGVGSLQAVWVAKSSARQRRGRAGRTQPGVCYHMFSERRRVGVQGAVPGCSNMAQC